MIFTIALLVAIFFVPHPWGLVLVITAGAIDIAETGLFLWWSQRRKASVGVEALVGQVGVAVSDLWPEGQIRVAGELWKARCDGGCDAGANVVIRKVEGLTLLVDAA